jgi:hypothetical protein
MTNVIIRNNKSTAGGGMYTIGLPGGGAARPELDRVEFSSNTALASGGGMLNASSGVDCIPIIENSAFLDNKAIESGGGLYNGNCKPVVTGTRFRGNTAARGGGIFNSGGESVFADIEVIANISQQDGAGIYNQGNSVFYNLDVKENFTDTGSGIGIYNGSSLRITNASIMNNKPRAGGGSGGGLYNGGQAVLTNVTIEDNEGSRGGGVFNGGSLIMANGRIDRNTAGSGGGLYNYAERRVASAVLANVTVDSNNASNTGSLGGGIFNYYEGATNGGADSAGSTNVLLSNVRITRNGGGAMYNHYMRTSDYGINVTFKNCTIADNVSSNADHAGIYTRKERRIGAGDGFPVFLRFHNTALVNNKDGGGSGSVNTTLWEDINGSSGIGAVGVIPNPNPATDDPADPDYGLNRETYEFSYIQGRDLSAYNSNLDGTSAAVNFVSPGTGDYRPGTGSDLIGAASKPLYRSEPFADFLVSELYFKVPHTAIAPATLSSLPIHLSGALSFTTIVYFLGYDLSFNVGDLRLNGNLEGSKAKPRPGALPLDIGAYQH